MSSSYRLSLENWLKTLDVKAHAVLDMGGSQLPVKDRVNSWNVDEYFISDLEQPHVDSPKPDVVLDMNVDIFNTEYTPGDFDLIFCLEVFDYIWNPVNAMTLIADCLAENGRAWVTFPTFYPHHQPLEDDALRYMQGGIKKLADNAGLKILQMIPRRPETDAIEQLWRRERMRAAKHFDHDLLGYIVEFQK